MAAIRIYVRFRDDPDVEGLCPYCFNPALQLYHIQRWDINDGIRVVGERVACRDCRKWTSPIKEYDNA